MPPIPTWEIPEKVCEFDKNWRVVTLSGPPGYLILCMLQ